MDQLIAAIAAAGGPAYQWRQIDPVTTRRRRARRQHPRGFLFRTDRGLAFVDRPGGTSTAPTSVVAGASGPQLSFSPGRIDPTNTGVEHQPQAAGRRVHATAARRSSSIGNHFNSKGGDEPLFGRFQPPTRITEAQRHQQAQLVNDFVDPILAIDGAADIVVLGDINDFDFSDTVSILKGACCTT